MDQVILQQLVLLFLYLQQMDYNFNLLATLLAFTNICIVTSCGIQPQLVTFNCAHKHILSNGNSNMSALLLSLERPSS